MVQVKRKGSKTVVVKDDDTRKPSNTSMNGFDDGETLRLRALHQLKMAQNKEVSYALRSNFHYNGSIDDDSPVNGKSAMFEERDCLHIIEDFNDDWYIGRVVKEGYDIGFIPSIAKMQAINNAAAMKNNKMRRVSSMSSKSGHSMEHDEDQAEKKRMRKPSFYPSVSVVDPTPPYEEVPLIRPIIFIGPSLKGYEVTDMMHRALMDYLKIRFAGRLSVEKIKKDISPVTRGRKSTVGSVSSPTKDQKEHRPSISRHTSVSSKAVISIEGQEEIDRIFELCKSYELLILESDNLNHPSQLNKSALAPQLVYIRIGQPKVLTRLIKSRGKAQVKHMGAQLVAAEKLAQANDDLYDVVIDENQLEDACEHLGEFLEAYYRAAVLPSFSIQQAKQPQLAHQISIK